MFQLALQIKKKTDVMFQLSLQIKKKTDVMFQLSLQMEVQNDKTAVADSDLRADVERWHKNKRRDLRELFVAFADRNIRYYEKVY